VTEENSSSAEEMAASAEELPAQAQRIQGMVEKFTRSNDLKDVADEIHTGEKQLFETEYL